jgi:hypothetical protein
MKIKIIKAFVIMAIASTGFVACDTDYGQVGAGIVDASNFETGSDNTATVKIYNHELQASEVRTDNLPVLMLGKYTDPIFGEVNANYISQLAGGALIGEKTADEEAEGIPTNGNVDENEIVMNVRLVLPFYSKKIETDSDGVSTYELDSIYGAGAIDIKVYEQTEYLRSLDPTTNFEDEQHYFANHIVQYNPIILGSLTSYMPNPIEVINYERDADYVIKQDDNGNDIIKERLAPQIEIPLDNAFFQNKIINHEGEDVLTNLDLFTHYLRGLYIEVSNAGNLMMLDASKAKVIITYKYTKTDGKSTIDTSDDTTEELPSELVYNLGFKTVTTFNNTINATALNAIQNPNITNGDALIYLKGTVGSEGILELFTPAELAVYRANDWLVNGASLDFYIDNTNAVSDNSYRIYLYDYDNQEPIIDFYVDQSSSTSNPLNSKFIYGGIILNDDDEFDQEAGTHYKINITEHINRLFNEVDDNGNYTYDNVKLGLKVLANPSLSASSSESNPLGIVLIGTNTSDAHKVKLNINYTKLVD